MDILVVGGTRFFGIPMIKALLEAGHQVTIATRGRAEDPFGSSVSRVILDRGRPETILAALGGRHFDLIIDKIAYCSNDVKHLLDHVSCDRYILMSSAAVYREEHAGVREEEFEGASHPLRWCSREEADYGEVKRQAECALRQAYPGQPHTLVRYPVVMGEHDYTGRLRFYVRHILEGRPMYVDDLDVKLSFIHERESGEFLAWLADHPIDGPVNGCSSGWVTIRDIIFYIEGKSGKKAVLAPKGDPAPYNGYQGDLTLDTGRAEAAGHRFSSIHDWLCPLLDTYI